jgi:hypothetical protein
MAWMALGRKKRIPCNKLATQNGLNKYPIRDIPWKYVMLTFSSLKLVMSINDPMKRKKVTVVKTTSACSPF